MLAHLNEIKHNCLCRAVGGLGGGGGGGGVPPCHNPAEALNFIFPLPLGRVGGF